MTKSSKRSAGLLMYRKRSEGIEVFLVHPGGPIWANKDKGAWTIPKGEYDVGEDPLAAAEREFHEETGFVANGPFKSLGSVQQKSGKMVSAWAFLGDFDPLDLTSNSCTIEWPPRSRKSIEIPEVDRGEWFSCERARRCIRAEQMPLLDSIEKLNRERPSS
jgi:predicted NUDIX family NTP pyrophosphohydrolase